MVRLERFQSNSNGIGTVLWGDENGDNLQIGFSEERL